MRLIITPTPQPVCKVCGEPAEQSACLDSDGATTYLGDVCGRHVVTLAAIIQAGQGQPDLHIRKACAYHVGERRQHHYHELLGGLHHELRSAAMAR